MKSIWILLVAGFLPAGFSFRPVPPDEILNGVGVSGVKLDQPIEQVIETLGNNYKVLRWEDYSVEFFYPDRGLSCFVRQNDSTHKVFCYEVRPAKWSGITESGLVVNKQLRLKDVLESYGPAEWSGTIDTTQCGARYVGICFTINVNRVYCIGPCPQADSAFAEHPIVSISVGKPGTL